MALITFTEGFYTKKFDFLCIGRVQKMNFSIEDCFSKYEQICSFLLICSQLQKKSQTENFIFCVV